MKNLKIAWRYMLQNNVCEIVLVIALKLRFNACVLLRIYFDVFDYVKCEKCYNLASLIISSGYDILYSLSSDLTY